MGFEVVHGEMPEPRPPSEKIRSLIRSVDFVIAVLTRRDKVEGTDAWRPPAWVHQEIGMAYEAGKPFAVFVEGGVQVAGLETLETQHAEFNRADLGEAAPRVVRYLTAIKSQLTGVPQGAEVTAVSRALQNELYGMVAELMAPQSFADWRILKLAILSARISGKLFLLPTELVQKIEEGYDAHDSMRKALQERTDLKSPESMLVNPHITLDTLPRGGDLSEVGKLTDPALETQRLQAIEKVFIAYLELLMHGLPPAAQRKLVEEMAKSVDGGLSFPPPPSAPNPPPSPPPGPPTSASKG